jgi:NAD(P)H-dependent FMN reductase
MEPRIRMKFVVVYGSVRSARQGIRAVRFISRQLRARGHEVVLFDPQELQLPLLDRMYKEYEPGQAPDPLPWMADEIAACDGVVVVTGEYNHSLPPALSNTLDHFLEEWSWRPSAIVCYSAGRYGGVRAAVQLRALLAELGMPSIPSLLPIGQVQDQLDDEGRPRDDGGHLRRAARFLDELEWYARALGRQRAGGTPY